MKLRIPILFVFTVFIAACSGKKKEIKVDPEFANVEGTYFSIRQFIRDQWEMNKMLPITFERIIVSDEGRDSSFISGFKMELGHIMETFANTDIGDKKYLGKYSFSESLDSASNTRTYFYDANDPEFYTQKLQIITGASDNQIKNVYIEAAESSGWTRTSLKLYYAPGKLIRIIESKKARFVSPDVTTTEYRFPEERE